ncbi:hypothetical protein AK830_g12013 [Neonectria ditissima]|uniref:Myb-like domain-containing protein n=1 Tax=Neonectria ditissima TaxID=78410 RepID=A0A0P7B1J5_9HYPO|nr:hypothetical protein AK830_g12013 [Neonectria ditissima]
MPKHTRNSSSSQSRYGAPMPVSLAPSPLYSQQRMTMPSNYYNIPTSSSSSSSMALQAQVQQQQQIQQPTYESYAAANTPSGGVSVPPPIQHRASSGAWTPQDDQQLLSARMQGLNWGQIQANFFPTKTPNACRKRHERLMERKGSDDWDNQKLQRLARDYMSMRKEIWSGLAARTGEKWNVVEQKVSRLAPALLSRVLQDGAGDGGGPETHSAECTQADLVGQCMSNGLKNLQSAARAGARRDRLESGGGALSGYDDDSGISGMGLTPVDELDASYSSPETTSSAMHSAHSSTASAAATYQALQQQQQQQQQHHQQQQQQQHHQQQSQHAPMAAALGAYGMGAYGAGYGGHGYSSSVSSTASAGHGFGGHGHSQGNSPYLSTHRPQSSDMAIPTIINRPRGGM